MAGSFHRGDGGASAKKAVKVIGSIRFVLGLGEDAVMYINFWYPIGLSKEIIADEPFCAQVFGLPFVAFAIPCSGRRKSGNWMLDPLPLMSGADEALPQVSDLSLN